MSRRKGQEDAGATAFAPARRGRGLDLRLTAGLGLLVAPLFVAHLGFGANQPLAAQVLTVFCALALTGSLLVPAWRRDLAQVRGLAPVAVGFTMVLLVGLITLTPGPPGAAHPIWAWAGQSPAITVNRTATVLALSQLLGLGAIFLAATVAAVRRDRARRLVSIVLWSGAIWVVAALILFLSGAQIGLETRLTGGFLSANSAASVLGLLLVLAAGRALAAWRRHGWRAGRGLARWGGHLALVLVITFALVLTGSRMGLAATAVAVLTLFAWEAFARPGGSVWSLLLGVGLIAVVGTTLALGHDLTLRRTAGLADDAAVRAEILGVHWRAFLDAPIWGYGLGSFTDMNSYLMSADTYGPLWRVRAAHNVYVQWLEEAGLLGAAPMFATIGLVILAATRRAVAAERGASDLRALVAANLVILLHGLTDFALQVPSIAVFWSLLLGLQFGFAQVRSAS